MKYLLATKYAALKQSVGNFLPTLRIYGLALVLFSPVHRRKKSQVGGVLGEDCLSTQCEFRSPAHLGFFAGTRRAVNRGRLFLGYFLLATQKKVTDETTSHLTNPAKDAG